MAEQTTIKIKKILEAGKIIYPATILDAVKDATSVIVNGEETNENYGLTLRQILAKQSENNSEGIDALDKKLHGNSEASTQAEKDGELKTLEDSLKKYTDDAIDDINASDNVSDTVAGISVKVDQENGAIQTPVVTVADNAVTYTAKVEAAEGVQAVDRNLTAASTTSVLKGDAISAIKNYVDATVTEAGSDASTAISDLNDKLYGEGGDILSLEGRLDTIEGNGDGSIKKAAADATASAIAQLISDSEENPIDESFDTLKEIADWILSSEENAEGLDAATRLNNLETAVGVPASGEGDDAVAASGLYKAVADEATRATGAEGALSDRLDVLEGAATVAGSVAEAKAAADAAQADVDALEELVGEVPESAEAETVVGYAKELVDAEEAARKAQIGELGKVSAKEGAADHTVKSYVDAKVSALNSSLEDLDTENNVSEAVAGITVQVDQVDGAVSTPVVTVTAAEVTCTEGTAEVTADLAVDVKTSVLDGSAIAEIKKYVDNRFSTAACTDTEDYADVF